MGSEKLFPGVRAIIPWGQSNYALGSDELFRHNLGYNTIVKASSVMPA